MKKTNKQINKYFKKHYDFIAINIISFTISFIFSNLIYLHSLTYYSLYLYLIIYACIIFPVLLIDSIYMPFSGVLRRSNVEEIINLFIYVIRYILSSITFLYIFKLSALFSRAVFLLTYCFYIIICFVSIVIWKHILNSKLNNNERKLLLIVANKNNINNILLNINNEKYKPYDIKGLCIADENKTNEIIGNYKVLCNKNNLYRCVIDNNIDEIFIACSPKQIKSSVIDKIVEKNVKVHINIEDFYNLKYDSQKIDSVGIYETLEVGKYDFTQKQLLYFLLKRLFDIAFSIFMLLPLLLLTIIIKILYILSGDNCSIFYTQERIGINGTKFILYKFRSMVPNAKEELNELLKNSEYKKEWVEYHKFKNDPRITTIGKVLRMTSLDEFPQFINVLKGDMSIIGPRPLIEGELKMHNGLKLYERIKPGITGWWACNGRSNITYEERLELEYYYVKNCSLSLDILVFIRTIYCVLTKVGAK